MPSTNGVYSLPSGYLAVTGATIEASQHNPPLEDIAAALTLRLSRDGTAAMSGSIQFAPGTVNVPGAVFSSDITTGFYSLGAGAGIGVSVGGVTIAKFLPGGVVGSRVVGEIVPFAGTAAPSSLWQLPYGQTLSRTAYAALWALAQIEIANGNALYNNGDGSTTFGILDMRGRLPIAWDKMGATASGRLTTAGGGVDGTTLGAVGGSQNHTLTAAESAVLTYTSTGTVVASFGGSSTNIEFLGLGSGGTVQFQQTGGSGGTHNFGEVSFANNVTTSSNAGGQAHTIVPPVVVTNYILFAGGAV